jgi:hypothetical protein
MVKVQQVSAIVLPLVVGFIAGEFFSAPHVSTAVQEYDACLKRAAADFGPGVYKNKNPAQRAMVVAGR